MSKPPERSESTSPQPADACDQAEASLRQSEERHRDIVQTAMDGFWLTDPQGRLLEVNAAYCRMSGYSEQELQAMCIADLEAVETSGDVSRHIQQIMARGEKRFETRHRRKDGSLIDVEVSAKYQPAEGGRMVVFLRDITERKRAAEALRESEKRLHDVLDGLGPQMFVGLMDPQGTVLLANRPALVAAGISPESVFGQPVADTFWFTWSEAVRQRLRAAVARAARGEQVRYDEQIRIAQGRLIWLDFMIQPLRDETGSIRFLIPSGLVITERKQAEEKLRESEQLLRHLTDNLPNAMVYQLTAEPDGGRRFTFVSRAVERLNEVTVEQVLADAGAIYSQVLPEYLEVVRQREAQALENLTSLQVTVQSRLPSGRLRWFEYTSTPRYLADGRLVWDGVEVDITERKWSEEEKIILEAQLQQAQKMESVGRLAGGVAHDFNNMLGVILGYAEIALGQVNPSDPLHADLEEIVTAAQRSAKITRQLLAFARKQTVTPKVLDLNETLAGMHQMLGRLIGEEIQLDWRPDPELWPVKVDPSQIEQILANLCVNARDAIAGPGRIAIQTGNGTFGADYCAAHPGFVPGEYAWLSVRDDGRGMDRETLAHIFEPFFTTKAVGEGTGLGLAMVYGAVQQHNGFVIAQSEPGKGSTFTIYLPRQVGANGPAWAEDASGAPRGGRETILLVEDEPAILALATKMLQKQGYMVLAANAPGEAGRLAKAHSGRIDLLLTDVIMPEINGRELWRQLSALRPDIKCLFMSGYPANVIADRGVLGEGAHFIQKPFGKKELAARVREALDRKI